MATTLRINIFNDISKAKQGFGIFKQGILKAIEAGIRQTAQQLLVDCRPYIPMLTGALRDSGRVEQLENLAFNLVWDAANPANGYIYAKKQYEEVLQHVDGRYAAKWVENTLGANKGKYTFLASRYMAVELQKIFGEIP